METLPKTLDAEELRRIREQPNTKCRTGLRNRAMIEVMYQGALRVSEACNLKTEDVRGNWLHVIHGKGGKDRDVFIQETLWLDRWREQRPAGKWFFCTLSGGRIHRQYVWALMKRLAARIGLDEERVSPHVLRHTRATDLLHMGVNLRVVQALLGHADLSTTEIYTHVRPDDMVKAIQDAYQAKL